MDATTLAAADHAARHWIYDGAAPVRLGSEAHKQAFCRMFHETFNPYKPSIIPWPKLDPEALGRLTSLPIWDIAVQTEGKARLRMLSYAAALRDPALSAAIGLNGWEEGRHKEVLSDLVRTYGIVLAPEPPYLEPRDPEWAYLVTGFSECIDSFFAFGLFEVAKRSGFFAGIGRYVRTGHPGRGTTYSAVCELARMASSPDALVAATMVRITCGGRVDVSGLG